MFGLTLTPHHPPSFISFPRHLSIYFEVRVRHLYIHRYLFLQYLLRELALNLQYCMYTFKVIECIVHMYTHQETTMLHLTR